MLTKTRSNAVAEEKKSDEKKSRVERKQQQKKVKNKDDKPKSKKTKTTPDAAEKAETKKTRRQQKAEGKKEKRKQKKPRRRIFPIWLRIIVVTLLCAAGLVLGAMIGYGIIGDGDPKDVLKIETWQHIIDIVVKEE